MAAKISLPPEVPEAYFKPLKPFNSKCDFCSLKTYKAVPPSSPDRLEDVKLIIISDHPGHYEEEYRFCQVPANLVQKRKGSPFRNGGQFIRDIIREELGLDPWRQVYYTNALKCDPRDKVVSETKHIAVCCGAWLIKELKDLPKVPVLVAGFKAFAGFKYAYPDYAHILTSLNNLRREVIEVDERKVLFTYNPAAISRCEFKEPDRYTVQASTGELIIASVRDADVLPGMPLWVFLKDIEPLKKLIT